MKTSVEKTEALKLCKERKKLIKEAIEARYCFAAAHVSYTLSLKNIGIVLRKYAEIVEPVVGNSNDVTGTCDGSSCYSPAMLPVESPVSGRCSYMRSSSSGGKSVALYADNVENCRNGCVKVGLIRNCAENGGGKSTFGDVYAEIVEPVVGNSNEITGTCDGSSCYSPAMLPVESPVSGRCSYMRSSSSGGKSVTLYADNVENCQNGCVKVGLIRNYAENGGGKSTFGDLYAEIVEPVVRNSNEITGTGDGSSCYSPAILPVECPVSGRCSYMRSSGSKAVTVKFCPFVENVENGMVSPFNNVYAENVENGGKGENGDVMISRFRNVYAGNGENVENFQNGGIKTSAFGNVYAENGGVKNSHFRNVYAENGENVEIYENGDVEISHFGNGYVENREKNVESPLLGRCRYMKASGTKSVTVKMNPFRNMYAQNADGSVKNSPFGNAYAENGENVGNVERGDVSFVMPPPPPPLPEPGSTWDYFDPGEDSESFRFVGLSKSHQGSEDFGVYNELDDDKFVTPESSSNDNKSKSFVNNGIMSEDGDGLNKASMVKSVSEPSSSKKNEGVVKGEMGEEIEDPSEFITHRAKDFLSSIKDIEHRFFRASESGREVYRMLEANKIRVGYSEAKVGSSVSDFFAALRIGCCRTKMSLVSNEPSEGRTKVITWKRTTSSRSSSSRNHLTTASKDDNDDSGSDFAEEFCMISGSHSSTLERLYAWERKLYDEVKASETIRKEYDRKCDQLRHQFAKDMSTHVIDKTRAVVKDLHSRIRVALHAVNAISKRIEKMRDDELQPQLVELIQGLIRMWKSMLECHHAQYITISLAYHAKTSSAFASQETRSQIMTELEEEIELFGLSFANWINSHTTYVEALNGWLQNCIMLPRERTSRRRAFSPRRVLAPPIFVLSRDWSAGIKALPSEELSNAIKGFLSDLRHSIRQQAEEQKTVNSNKTDESDGKVEENNDDRSLNLCSIHSSLAKVLDRLTKFSEASLKMCEDIRQKCETARNAYCNYRPHRL